MERFSEEEMLHLVAYQNLYGLITPRRYDMLLARLGMDVAAPHMKKGRKPRFKDHLFVWSRGGRQRTGREMLGVVKQWQAFYEQTPDRPRRRGGRRQPSEGGEPG